MICFSYFYEFNFQFQFIFSSWKSVFFFSSFLTACQIGSPIVWMSCTSIFVKHKMKVPFNFLYAIVRFSKRERNVSRWESIWKWKKEITCALLRNRARSFCFFLSSFSLYFLSLSVVLHLADDKTDEHHFKSIFTLCSPSHSYAAAATAAIRNHTSHLAVRARVGKWIFFSAGFEIHFNGIVVI